MSIGTRLYTRLHGELVGTDQFGIRYYQEKKAPQGRRRRRWAMYPGEPDPTTIPAEWHAWIHYTTDAPLTRDVAEKPWQQEHIPNRTGSAGAYLPPGHDLRGGRRERSTTDYEGWKPDAA